MVSPLYQDGEAEIFERTGVTGGVIRKQQVGPQWTSVRPSATINDPSHGAQATLVRILVYDWSDRSCAEGEPRRVLMIGC